MEVKAGYYIEYYSSKGYGLDTDCALGPFVSKHAAMTAAQLVRGYWYCYLVATDGYLVTVRRIDSGYNPLHKAV